MCNHFFTVGFACLVSITSWAQVACLSGYSRPTVLRALHSVVPRIISRTPWDLDSTLAWCCHITYTLPATRDTIFFRVHRWVKNQAVWSGQAYASWHMPHKGAYTAICADWCYDYHVLQALTPLLDPSKHIHVGHQPRGEGTPAFPVISELSS